MSWTVFLNTPAAAVHSDVRADSDFIGIQNRSHIMGMHILNRKRQNTMMVFGAVGADDMHIRILLHLFHCQRCQLILTLCDLLKTDSFDITDRFAQRIRACSVDGSRLEFMRHLSIGSPVRVTYSIISPPVRKGGIFPATPSCRTAHQFPSEPASYVRKGQKSTSSSDTLTGICGTLCAPSATSTMPFS